MNVENYLKENGVLDKHWGQIILGAFERGFWLAEEQGQAGNWTCCPCGRLDDGVQRTPFLYAPLDDVLYDLGEDFCEAVCEGEDFYKDVMTAAKLLIAIEERSKYLHATA